MLPKLIITDIDGVWTDGGMYYSQTGDEWKKFNTSDSAGVLFCKKLCIPVAIISGEDTEIVNRRSKKLNIDYQFLGIEDKLKCALDLCKSLSISLEDVAFIGDDIGDLKLLTQVGFSAAPNSAADYIKKYVDYIVPCKGGEGAFRAFVEYILIQNNKLDKIINGYLNTDGK